MVGLTRDTPPSSLLVLESAERRLLGAIKHAAPAGRFAAEVERVRRAQLGCLKARERVAAVPTELDDDEHSRHHANLATSRTVWETASLDDILAYYASGRAKRAGG